MPRSIRIEFARALYHVMARCNRRENIFMDDEDRRAFLRSLAEVKPLHQRVQNMVQTVTNVSLTPFLFFPKLKKVLKMLAFGWILKGSISIKTVVFSNKPDKFRYAHHFFKLTLNVSFMQLSGNDQCQFLPFHFIRLFLRNATF